jgi:hypothetical protein
MSLIVHDFRGLFGFFKIEELDWSAGSHRLHLHSCVDVGVDRPKNCKWDRGRDHDTASYRRILVTDGFRRQRLELAI